MTLDLRISPRWECKVGLMMNTPVGCCVWIEQKHRHSFLLAGHLALVAQFETFS
jgi:hypothetical protein